MNVIPRQSHSVTRNVPVVHLSGMTQSLRKLQHLKSPEGPNFEADREMTTHYILREPKGTREKLQIECKGVTQAGKGPLESSWNDHPFPGGREATPASIHTIIVRPRQTRNENIRKHIPEVLLL